MERDLTVGKTRSVLWRFCLPLFGSIIFQQIYNIADSLIAGKFIGEAALAAVGNSYEITLIFISFAFGCNIGCSVIVSGLFGSKDFGRMKCAVWTCLISSAVLCAVLASLGLGLCDPLLRLINTPENIFQDSALYLRIYILGLFFLFFYNLSTGIFSAMGDSKTPFWFLAASSTANVFMDILFVKTLRMGVAGVAWATFICQGAACLLAVGVIFRRLKKIDAPSVGVFSLPLFRRFVIIAVPSTLQQCCISVGNIVIQSIINSFGSAVIAGYAAAVKLNNLVITSFSTLANGISNFTAQNLGAGKPERIKEGFKAGIQLVGAISLPIIALYLIAAGPLVGFFMDNGSETALETGKLFLRILSPFYFMVAVKLVADAILRGESKMRQFLISTFTDLILRVVLAFVFSRFLGSLGIWCAWPVGWTVSTAISIVFYVRGHSAAQNAESLGAGH
ncbi:MAG: MATE family efflux transporter [Oscillospiraceae bacterium]